MVNTAAFMSLTKAPVEEYTRREFVESQIYYNFSLSYGQEWMLLPFSKDRRKPLTSYQRDSAAVEDSRARIGVNLTQSI
jgi:hypothetical protein